MANLLDTIRQNQGQVLGQKPQVTDETQKVQKLMRAKSGRAVGGGDVASSNLQEQQAVAGAGQAMQQLAQPAQIAQAGLEQKSSDITQGEQIQGQEVAQQRRMNTLQDRVKTEALLRDLERDKGKIDVNRDSARLEQAAFQLRMQSQEYVDNLEREGKRARLDDETAFNDQLTASIFGENEQLLRSSLGNKSILDVSDREFKDILSRMEAKDAWNVHKAEEKSAHEKTKYKVAGETIPVVGSVFAASMS